MLYYNCMFNENNKLDIKIIKNIPKNWHNSFKPMSDKVFCDIEFAIYCKTLYASLIGIKKFYENDFNKDNSNTIDEYIGFFNELYEKFLKLSIDENLINEYFLKKTRFTRLFCIIKTA